MMETFAAVARHFNQKDMLHTLEHRRRTALRAKATSLPPKQRIEHLQKRHREATAELKKLITAQAATESEIRLLQARSKEQYDAVEDQRELVEDIRVTLENAELDLPPTAAPKQVGRQLHPCDLGAAIKKASIPEILEALSGKYSEEYGGELADVVGRRTMQSFDMLHSAHEELSENRRTVKAQVEADRKAALKLHQEINLQGVQSGDKRGREGHVDQAGDERMNRSEVQDVEDDGGYTPWQTAVGKRKKGKGRVCVPTGSQSSTLSSPALPSAFAMGPLATAPRTATGVVGSAARDPSPPRPSASGTPAVATESGEFQRSGPTLESEMIPTISQLSVTKLAEPETPYLDSLPSTPRAGEVEEATPCPADLLLPETMQPMEQDSQGAPPGAAPPSASADTQPEAAEQPLGSGGTN